MRVQLLSAAGLALILSACSAAGTSQSVPPTYAGPGVGANSNDRLQPNAVDTTSILKQLTKTVAIGSTVDPTNGDKTPYGLLYVKSKPYGKSPLAKGDLVVCNYADSGGTLGNGTTVDVLSSKPGSKPKTYVQNAKFKGCASVTISDYDAVYAADSSAKNLTGISSKGKIVQTLSNKALVMPWSISYDTGYGYPPGDAIYTSDMSTGNVVTVDLGSGSAPSFVTAITGFAVSGSTPGSMRGPAGVQYSPRHDTLYILDGVTNSLISVAHAYAVLQQNGAIKVSADGKTFTGPAAKNAKLLHIGKPLNDPIASTLLPNGNLVISNGAGSNTLVEIASNGKVLATKVVDKGKAHAVPGLASNGTSDTNTVIYFNDGNKNNVQLLTR